MYACVRAERVRACCESTKALSPFFDLCQCAWRALLLSESTRNCAVNAERERRERESEAGGERLSSSGSVERESE